MRSMLNRAKDTNAFSAFKTFLSEISTYMPNVDRDTYTQKEDNKYANDNRIIMIIE